MKVYCDSTFFLESTFGGPHCLFFHLDCIVQKHNVFWVLIVLLRYQRRAEKLDSLPRVCVWLQQSVFNRRKQTNPASKTKTKHKTLKESVSEWQARAQLRERARLIPTDISGAECCVSCLCKGEEVIGVISTLTIEPVHIEN